MAMYFKEKTTLIEDETLKDILNYLELKEENIFIIIVFIYVLILKEFEPKEYISLLNYEKRINKYSKSNLEKVVREGEIKKNSQNIQIESISNQLKYLTNKIDNIRLNFQFY